jgi:hypothetical protein
MTETANPRIQARLNNDDPTAAWLTERSERMNTGSHNKQAVLELAMWRTALEIELRRIRLTLPQARCIAHVCDGSPLEPALGLSIGMVFGKCYDAFRLARQAQLPEQSSYAAKWGIDEQQLLDYLGSLGPAADHALLDAIARWWQQDNPEETVEGFAKVGLRVTDVETLADPS